MGCSGSIQVNDDSRNPSSVQASNNQRQVNNHTENQRHVQNNVNIQQDKVKIQQSYIQQETQGKKWIIDKEIKGQEFENLDQRLAATNAILEKEETEMEMKNRLSVYGKFKDQYTEKQIYEANLQKDFDDSRIFRFQNSVICTQALKDLIRPKVREYEKDNLYDMSLKMEFSDPWFTPVYNLLYIGIRMETIRKYVVKCVVAKLKMAQKEYWEDIRADAKVVSDDLVYDSSEYAKEYRHLLLRVLDKIEKTNGNPENPEIKSGDRNDYPFILPGPDPNILRYWTQNWELFDTEVPEEGAWIMCNLWQVFSKEEEMKLPEEILIRDELDKEPDLSFDIDGDVAWNEIPKDIVKDDITTTEQDEIWRLRGDRSDLNDPKKMAERRKRIEKYFIEKYEWDSSKLDPYKRFTENLQADWEHFQSLCNEL